MSSVNHNNLVFDKYVIHRDSSDVNCHIVEKYLSTGEKVIINDENEKKTILSGEAVEGSLAYSCDDKPSGWAHRLCHVGQLFHKFLTGHFHTDEHVMHGFIIAGKGKESSISKYNTKNCDPTFDGVILHEADYLKYPDTSRVLIYRPKDDELRNQIKDYAIKTAFPKQSSQDKNVADITKWKFYEQGCAQVKAKFSFFHLIISPFFNGFNIVGANVSDRVSSRIAYHLADVMMDKPLKDKNGQDRVWFCCSYVTTIFQISIYMNNIRKVLNTDKSALEAFKKDANGQVLDRKQLAEKIQVSLKKEDSQDPIAKQLFDTCKNEKFARVNSKYLMSGRFAELANSLSYQMQCPT